MNPLVDACSTDPTDPLIGLSDRPGENLLNKIAMRTPNLAIGITAVAALLQGCSGGAPPPTPDPASQRSLSQGEIVGFESDGAHGWRGIPFARPPVGPGRWRPPLPPEPWTGVRESIEFGNECPQLDRSGGVKGSEDCLVLNVHAPSFALEDVPGEGERLPVMVFVHGGGQSIGSAEVFDGSRLARENRVVVVSVHYRLGILGWFSHPALRTGATTPEEASGNWATLDLIRALRWVQENVTSFGGDPDRVTIFGESAGGINIYSLLLAPAAKGLFHRAISQSGFPTTFSMTQAENFSDDEAPGDPASSSEVLLSHLIRDSRATDRTTAKQVLAGMSDDEIESYLRGKSAEELLAIFGGSKASVGGGMYISPFVLRDGHVIPDLDPLDAFGGGEYNAVPVVLGTNRDEHKLFQAFMSPHVWHVFGLPMGFHDADRYDRVADYGARLWKAAGADEPASAMRSHQGASVYGYRFDWDEERPLLWLDVARLIGAGHAVELLFVFGGTNSDFAKDWFVDDVESAETLSARMRSYWAEFAASGSPGRGQDGSLPEWAPWNTDPGAAKFMILDTERDGGLRMSPDALTRDAVLARVGVDERLASTAERCEVYQTFVQWSDAITPEAYLTLEEGGCAEHPLPGRTAFD